MSTDYSQALKEVKKLSLSLKKSLEKVGKTLSDAPEEEKKKSREDRKKELYQVAKKKYKFTDTEKILVLDDLVDPFNLTNISSSGFSEYEIGDFLKDHVPEFEEKAEILMKKCRDDIEDLLPPTVASSTRNKNTFQDIRLHGMRKKIISFEEEAEEKEEETDEEDS